MGIEIERKFLIANDSWRHGAIGVPYAQGYLSRGTGRTVRVRIAGEKAFLTIKGPVIGISRPEFEYPIPVEEARQLLLLCEGPIIEKTRFRVSTEDHLWEIDDFHGDNMGLVVAEVELRHPEESISFPSWLGREVTGDSRYYNSNLTIHPYKEWKREGEGAVLAV
jgi:adenylate cyclase